MTSVRRWLRACCATLLLCSLPCRLLSAQQSATSQPAVPRLIAFSAEATDGEGKALSGLAGVTFAIYKDQHGGAPLWIETQNVQVDAKGKYSIQLGATKPEGLPLELFSSGEARWLGVSVNGGTEQPRVLLLSVPYALKAADAETIGGLPASAFVLAAPAAAVASSANSETAPPPTLGGSGTLDFVPLWTPNGSTLGNSVLFQSGSGSTAKVGINTTAPVSTLDVNGAETVRGNLSLPAKGPATATGGKNSQPTTLTASAFNSSTKAAVAQIFRWQAEPVGNNTSAPGGSLNLLYGSGTSTISETGFKIARNGNVTFAPGQIFPGTGTVTSIGLTAPPELTVSGSPITGAGTLALTWTVPPSTLNTANSIVERDQTGSTEVTDFVATGNLTASSISATSVSNSISGGDVSVYNTQATGESAYPGSFANGSDGVDASGGAGDPNTTTNYGGDGVKAYGGGYNYPNNGYSPYGGTGVAGYGGDGAVQDGPGGYFQGGSHSAYGQGIVAVGGSDIGGYFSGAIYSTSTITGAVKNFKIDHPLDPANKYLVHSSIESSEMMDLYTGNVITDAKGEATVQLPEWFEALNTDFRYQLTVIGQFAQAIIASEIQNHQFQIRTNAANVKVSWQVTGVRQDAYAKAHPLVVEEEKGSDLRGYYINPELYGAPKEKSVTWARFHGLMARSDRRPVPRHNAIKPIAQARNSQINK